MPLQILLGFLEVTELCTERSINGSSEGYITSPGFPSNYPLNQNCSLTLELPKGFLWMNITIVEFNLQTSSSCSYDYLNISTNDKEVTIFHFD